MVKLQLPTVTLVMVETLCHELAAMAVQDCLDVAEFGGVLICTDRPDQFTGMGYTRCMNVPDWPRKIDWCKYIWHDMPQHVFTEHALLIQWDSWVTDVGAWRKEFLDYDFIGAPWWYRDGMNVGNTGFAIKSKRLMDFLAVNNDRFPVTSTHEDDLLCRGYRHELEAEGFRWAPESLAHEFAFETRKQRPKTFGFHAMFNWPQVLDKERLAERVQVASESEYIVRTGMLDQIYEREPWLKDIAA